MKQNIVLAVDDEPFNLEILEEILGDDHQYHSALSGPECLLIAAELQPNVILLDVSMPDMDGYEVCRELKRHPSTQAIPVMFVSARGALDERIEGYNAGGDDYIVKPFAREELEAKLKGLFKIQGQQKELENQVQQATDMAFSVMSNSSEIGVVMQFVERTAEIDSLDTLSEALLKTLSDYGLAAALEFRCDDGELHHFSSRGNCSPIVIELFDLLKHKGRIYTFAPRMMVNHSRLSILLLNMPVGDEEKLGRLRDHLCFIGNSAEQCLHAILMANVLAAQEQALGQAIVSIKDKFEDLVWVLNQSHEMNEGNFRDLQEKFEMAIPKMGLEDDQEQYIYRTLEQTIEKSTAREDLLMNVKVTFNEIERALGKLLL